MFIWLKSISLLKLFVPQTQGDMMNSMNSTSIPRFEDLLAKVAGDGYSFKMVCLDVVSHMHVLSLFSANIANVDRSMFILP